MTDAQDVYEHAASAPTQPDFSTGVLPSTPCASKHVALMRCNAHNPNLRIEPYLTTRDARSGVLSNADGTPKRIPSNARNSGVLAPSFTDNKHLIPKAMVFLFRNMSIAREDVAEILAENGFSADAYPLKERSILKWRDRWQKGLWSSEFFLGFVRANVETYNTTKQPSDPTYVDLTADIKALFWHDPSRWHLHAAWADSEWQRYMRDVYVVACISTWANRLEPDAAGVQAGGFRQVYADVRATRETVSRPEIGKVPTRASVTSGPERQVREADLGRYVAP
ncbi:hypothetical protein H2199_004777 [Coniosporium tulheliwenetii]|uniref:Uncharacterized protein n=1 Tax=Coniosporium tulheliwenetii TaxID=3383036 RepID=A0ACC2Z3V5_9PEZI|nr:hypothetical protein H2199_004777 [Cladosporium sp. JES 115]